MLFDPSQVPATDLVQQLLASDTAMLLLDQELRLQYFVPGATALLDLSHEDQGQPVAEIARQLGDERLAQDAAQALDSGGHVEREVRRRGPQGEDLWLLIRARAYRAADDTVKGVVITYVDITNTKRTELALRATRERYRLMVESTLEYAMFTMDEEGHIEMWNQGAQRIFGYDEPEVLGKTGAIIFTAEDLAKGAYEREMATARDEGQAADERWHVRKDGSRFWGSGVTTSLWDGDRLRGFAKVMRDNTKRKEAEEALRQSKEALEELNESLEQKVAQRTRSLQRRSEEVRALAAQLALAEQEERNRIAQVLHDDLQQRLYALQMQLAFVRSAHETGTDEAFYEELAQVEKELEQAISTTRQLNVDLSPPILHGEGLVDAIGWIAHQVEQQYRMPVQMEVSEAPRIADEGLRVLLFQAVRELLFNVVKHAGAREARVDVRTEQKRVSIQVSDEGAGFDPGVLQAPAGQSSGLATIHRRLKLVGGEMRVQSGVGQGTRVMLVAPLHVGSDENVEDHH